MNKLKFSFNVLPSNCRTCTKFPVDVGLGYTTNKKTVSIGGITIAKMIVCFSKTKVVVVMCPLC